MLRLKAESNVVSESMKKNIYTTNRRNEQNKAKCSKATSKKIKINKTTRQKLQQNSNHNATQNKSKAYYKTQNHNAIQQKSKAQKKDKLRENNRTKIPQKNIK